MKRRLSGCNGVRVGVRVFRVSVSLSSPFLLSQEVRKRNETHACRAHEETTSAGMRKRWGGEEGVLHVYAQRLTQVARMHQGQRTDKTLLRRWCEWLPLRDR